MGNEETTTVKTAQLHELLRQNAEMKSLINRGALVISNIVEIGGLGGENSSLMLQIPKILFRIQRNPGVMNDLQNVLVEFSKYIDDENPPASPGQPG